jgi:hypothetical protein
MLTGEGLAFAMAVMLASGCASNSVAPAAMAPPRCAIDSRLAGTWTSERRSQLGPAAMRLELGCDCTHRSRVRVLLQSIHERGHWWVEGERLHFTRATGVVTVWPYRLVGDRLLLEEGDAEPQVYRRRDRPSCD